MRTANAAKSRAAAHVVTLAAAIVILSGCNMLKRVPGVEVVSLAPEAFAEVIADTTVVRLDVRTRAEHDAGAIARSVNVDVLGRHFRHKAAKAIAGGRRVAVYCLHGIRGSKATAILTGCGYEAVNLEGGLKRWKQEGFPTETKAAATKEDADGVRK